ncbi:MAG TPA: hypothetical protein VGW78_00805 [Candidatus Babeliales bacterium]|nr:hypothetical protein [Candidatus Babeliales bacterium]
MKYVYLGLLSLLLLSNSQPVLLANGNQHLSKHETKSQNATQHIKDTAVAENTKKTSDLAGLAITGASMVTTSIISHVIGNVVCNGNHRCENILMTLGIAMGIIGSGIYINGDLTEEITNK